jgi:hypothetical protein
MSLPNSEKIHDFIKAYIHDVGTMQASGSGYYISELDMKVKGEGFMALHAIDADSIFSKLAVVFPHYLNTWRLLDNEYQRTPWWHPIRKELLINRMHRLTKQYEKWFGELMETTK